MIDYIVEKAMGLIIVVVLLSFLVIFLLLLAIVGIVGYLLYRKIVQLTSLRFAPDRLFDAPPQTQWDSAFELWLYQLEDLTGIQFTHWPGQILVGCLIIAAGSALILSLLLIVLLPQVGMSLFPLILGGGSLIGVATGFHLGQPMGHLWKIRDSSTSHPSSSSEQQDGFTLGESIDNENDISLW